MKFKMFATTLFFAACFLTASATAQWLPQGWRLDWWNPVALAQFIFPNMPAEWFRVPEVIWYIIIPFVAAYTVLYGILIELRIFRRTENKVNIAIAFCLTFLLLPSGVLTTIVTYFYSMMGFFALIVFGVLFTIGTLLWAVGRGYFLYGEASAERAYARAINDINREIGQMEQERARLIDRLAGETNPETRAGIGRGINAINKKQASLEDRLRQIRRSF